MSRERGFEGETIAADYLIQQGYTILTRNFYSRYGELDIIARAPDGVIVFCEVKRYKKNSMVSPLEAVGDTKIKRLQATAQYYLLKVRQQDADCRFDLLVVEDQLVQQHLINII